MQQRDTVAIPFASGISPRIQARVLPADKLLVAQNCHYVLEEAGPQKRNGNISHLVRTSARYVPLNGTTQPTAIPNRTTFSKRDPLIPASWLYGWGIVDGTFAQAVDPFVVSPQPAVGQLLGVGSRDSEVVSWDGHRIFSYAPNQVERFGEAQSGTLATVSRGPVTAPVLRSIPFAKAATSQSMPDAADNGVLRTAAWINPDAVTVGYAAYDSTSGACLVFNSGITFQVPRALRVISVGPWTHILVADPTANSLEVRSFHQDTPDTLVSRSLGAVDTQFDVKKIDETSFVVIRSKGGVITALVCKQDGTILTSFVPDLGGSPATTNLAISCEIDANKTLGLVWISTLAVKFRAYNLQGAPLTVLAAVGSVAVASRMTVSPRVITQSGETSAWDVFVEDTVTAVKQVRVYYVGGVVSPTVPTSTLLATRHRIVLASHAVRVGNRNSVWTAPWLNAGAAALQYTWILCDSALLPVGKLDYGQANVDTSGSTNVLTSINWSTPDAAHPFKDRVVFHGALSFNVRVVSSASVASASQAPNGVFAESSIRFYELDFIPKLRSAEAGRTMYFAGAQLWAYDGSEAVEAGFHLAPEGTTYTPQGSGGALSAGSYRYRVDLCHKNAQGEEVRSWSVVSSAVTAVNNDRVSITIPQMPHTRREDAYFLIFRTEANGSVYYIVNSRNPISLAFIKNNPATASFTFLDGSSDSVIRAGEYHPANVAGNYVDPLPAPACEIVAGGRDRLWLAGGELAYGEIAPSRLFFPGQTPTFNPALNVQVDRNSEPITAIGFVGDITAVFRRTKTYVLDSDGPDNSYNGTWSTPRLAISDVGAVSQESVVLSAIGLWFQSSAGLRIISPSGSVNQDIGIEVDPIAEGINVSAAVVVPQYTQVRWYSRDTKDALVYNYTTKAWTTWTGLSCVGAVFWPVTNLAVLARGDGYLWVEDAATFTDAGSPYEMKVQTSWLHAKALGDFQRVRRFALFGQSVSPHTLRSRVFYDERAFHTEEFLDAFPGQGTDFLNSATWGQDFSGEGWGGGFWGDCDNDFSLSTKSDLWFRDNTYRFRHRPHRQKCSVFSVEFSDQGAPNAGFVPVVLALELGVKPGLDRAPTVRQ